MYSASALHIRVFNMNYLNLLITPLKPGAPTDEEISDALRAHRNVLLAASDWTQLPDVDLANKWDWAVYRQELRDMMNKGVPPKDIVFPTPPV